MNLDDALTQIAAQCGLDAAKLISFAADDEIGGFHPDPTLSRWPVGSMWDVEGRVLYALTRALRPMWTVEFGTFKGCSASHIATAMNINKRGIHVCVDPYIPSLDIFAPELRNRLTLIGDNAEHWLLHNPIRGYDLILEDTYHDRPTVRTIWETVKERGDKGAIVISHDAEHATSWREVQAGMTDAVGNAWRSYLIEPADCGLGIWRKP